MKENCWKTEKKSKKNWTLLESFVITNFENFRSAGEAVLDLKLKWIPVFTLKFRFKTVCSIFGLNWKFGSWIPILALKLNFWSVELHFWSGKNSFLALKSSFLSLDPSYSSKIWNYVSGSGSQFCHWEPNSFGIILVYGIQNFASGQ